MDRLFRLGTTSYIIQDDILPNVRYLGPMVEDIELLLFEVNDDNNLPGPATIDQMNALAEQYDLSYTVHLPLDLVLAAENDQRWNHSIQKAARAIKATLPLNPWAYIVHIEAETIPNPEDPIALDRWQDRSICALAELGKTAGDLQLLAVENLEIYSEKFLLPILASLPVSLCIDIGHFFKLDQDPLPFIKENLNRARVIHIHGSLDGKDHRGLDLVEPVVIKGIIDSLFNFDGVMTIEVFTERHLSKSLAMLAPHLTVEKSMV